MTSHFLPMTTAELMDRTMDIYKKTFGRQLGFAAIFGFLSYLAFIAIGVFFIIIGAFSSFFFLSFFNLSGNTFADGGAIILLIIAIALPILFLWHSVSSAGHILISKSAFYNRKENLPVGQLPRISLRIFGALIAQLLASVPFIAALLIGFSSGFFASLLHTAPWVLLLLSFIFVVLYLAYINTFSLAVAAAAFERTTFFNALLRSKQLIHGEFWKIAGMRLLWYAAVGAIASTIYGAVAAITMGISFASATLGFDANGAILSSATVVSTIVSFGVLFAIVPLDGIFQATLYFNQRIKKEGLDIEIRLQELTHE